MRMNVNKPEEKTKKFNDLLRLTVENTQPKLLFKTIQFLCFPDRRVLQGWVLFALDDLQKKGVEIYRHFDFFTLYLKLRIIITSLEMFWLLIEKGLVLTVLEVQWFHIKSKTSFRFWIKTIQISGRLWLDFQTWYLSTRKALTCRPIRYKRYYNIILYFKIPLISIPSRIVFCQTDGAKFNESVTKSLLSIEKSYVLDDKFPRWSSSKETLCTSEKLRHSE